MKSHKNYLDNILPMIEMNLGITVQEADGSDPFLIWFSGNLNVDLSVMQSIVKANKKFIKYIEQVVLRQKK